MLPQAPQRDLSDERDRLRFLLDVNNAVVSTLSLKDLLYAVSGFLRTFFPLDFANIGSLSEAAFTREDAELLEQIAAQVAIAVQNALNFERAERALCELTALKNNRNSQLLTNFYLSLTQPRRLRRILGPL